MQKTDDAILFAFYSMEEGTKYVLDDYWFGEINRLLVQFCCETYTSKKEFIFSRQGTTLFINGRELYNFHNKTNISLELTMMFGLSLQLKFSFAFPSLFALVLQHGGFQKLQKHHRTGEFVVVDGDTYRLVAA